MFLFVKMWFNANNATCLLDKWKGVNNMTEEGGMVCKMGSMSLQKGSMFVGNTYLMPVIGNCFIAISNTKS